MLEAGIRPEGILPDLPRGVTTATTARTDGGGVM